MRVGAHVSSQGGVLRVPERAQMRGATTAQCFLSSPRAWRFRAQQVDRDQLAAASRAHDIVGIFAHAPYLINLAASDQGLRERSAALLGQTVGEASRLGLAGVVWHPGSHRGVGVDDAIDRWARALRPILAQLVLPTPLYLENTAGGGGSLGRTPEELAHLRVATNAPEQVRIAIDTQHLFAAGYDLRDRVVRRDLVAELKARFGTIDVIHVNDSLSGCGSLADRHANLGEGAIGLEALAAFLVEVADEGTAALLEVPGDGDGPREEDVRGLVALVSSRH